MLERIPAALFLEWQEYYSISPFGVERQDANFGMLTAVVANALSGKKGRSFEVKDFMLCEQLEHKAEPQTPAQMEFILKQFAVNIPREQGGAG